MFCVLVGGFSGFVTCVSKCFQRICQVTGSSMSVWRGLVWVQKRVLFSLNTQHRDLFFQHLDEALIHNDAALELQQTKLTNIITDTECHLSTSTGGTGKITQYYHQFLASNRITNNKTLPALKAKLTKNTMQTTPNSPTTSTT